jgi:hypothetical protein
MVLLVNRTMLASPKLLLRLEGLLVIIAALVFYRGLGDSWLKFGLLFLVPDVFMIGYIFGTKIGATVYNLGHTYIAPLLLWIVCYTTHTPSLCCITAIWIAHIGFDRLLGYGLKYPSAFKETHLGKV